MKIKRSEGQKFIGCWCNEELIRKIDEQRTGSRSDFCREAIYERLTIKEPLDPSLARGASQIGKGGRKPGSTKYRVSRKEVSLDKILSAPPPSGSPFLNENSK